nr:MAG TPA: hypothetical protein [Caudoviricetes sp.]
MRGFLDYLKHYFRYKILTYNNKSTPFNSYEYVRRGVDLFTQT